VNESSIIYLAVNKLERLLKEDSSVTLMDARTAEEFAAGHVPGAINVPIVDLADYAQMHKKTSECIVTTMCGSTGRGEKASTILRSHGMANVQVMKGGAESMEGSGISDCTVQEKDCVRIV
jgi:phage shock protein E